MEANSGESLLESSNETVRLSEELYTPVYATSVHSKKVIHQAHGA